MKFRFHLLGLPHTQTTAAYCACAFTQKIVKFCRMMHVRGHEILLYSGEQNEAPCARHVTVFSEEERFAWNGKKPPSSFAYDVKTTPWRTVNGRMVKEVSKRAVPGDFLCIMGGNCQQPVAEALPHLRHCEYGIGYEGSFAKYRCFESSAWRHYVHGRYRSDQEGFPFDEVIPNYFDPAEFPPGDGKGNYLLFIGRMTRNKGPQIAVEVARRMGMKLVLAGYGLTEQEPGVYVCEDGTILAGEHLEYAGPVGAEKRAALMGGAMAVLAPTRYIEPFGAVAVEPQFCGTPVLASNFGAFPETVQEGVTGYLCGSVDEFAEAAEKVGLLDRALIRQKAVERFSLRAIAPQYERWFARIRGDKG